MRVAIALSAALLLGASLAGQSTPGEATVPYEVASVRPAESTTRYSIGPPVGGTVRARGIE